MKAVDTNLLELLKKSTRFVVPIYQRVYSWGSDECDQLWQDIVRAGKRENLKNHFTGSIVYIESDQGTLTKKEPHLIIDGQQRLTSVTLLLAALADRLEQLPEDEREPVDGFAPQKIRGLYLTNMFESGDGHFKLTLSKQDREALQAVVAGTPAKAATSRINVNYEFFVAKLASPEVDLADVCRGLDKLVVVDVQLTRGRDDPQLVFESMNATGKRLSQADLIRNFVLMSLPGQTQEQLYEGYWFPMEQLFQNGSTDRFDEFVRHYLTLKTRSIPRKDEIYEAFKEYASGNETFGSGHRALVGDLYRHATWFAAMALGGEDHKELAPRFAEIEQLATVAYPFQLQLYGDYVAGALSADELVSILDALISYIFRRAVCKIPTNSLNRTFATMASAIDPVNYVESITGRLLTLPDYRRFPSDEEFDESLRTSDMYNFKRRSYFFRKLENHHRKEFVPTMEYTIEHIMPQTLNRAWQRELGENWKSDHELYLHTLGNLTLTGYNPEYSNHLFQEKRDMKGGFGMSPLILNEGLRQLDRWSAAEISQRAIVLAGRAVSIWSRPQLSESKLDEYREQFNRATRFDWAQAHAILSAIPAGAWTGYYSLAEAVGTSAQAMAGHLARCDECINPHRVLTWDGKAAEQFRWRDPSDSRSVLDVLEAEGVKISGGRADPEQQLDVDDLLALVGDDEV